MSSRSELEDLDELMVQYGDQVMRIAFLYLKSLPKAEDAFQEVFLRVYKNRHRFEGKSSIKTWLLSITINVCKDMLKSAWWKRILPLTEQRQVTDGADMEMQLIAAETNKELLRHVMDLKTAYKDVVLLYYYQEMSTEEISEILGIPVGTVRNRLHRAREQLKHKLAAWREKYGSI